MSLIYFQSLDLGALQIQNEFSFEFSYFFCALSRTPKIAQTEMTVYTEQKLDVMHSFTEDH